MKLLRFAFILSLMLLSGHAWASDEESGKVIYKQKTSHNEKQTSEVSWADVVRRTAPSMRRRA